MQADLKSKCLAFLYAQVSKGNVPQIKKGMVEALEAFIEGLKADEQAKQMAKRMQLEQQEQAKEAGNE